MTNRKVTFLIKTHIIITFWKVALNIMTFNNIMSLSIMVLGKMAFSIKVFSIMELRIMVSIQH